MATKDATLSLPETSGARVAAHHWTVPRSKKTKAQYGVFLAVVQAAEDMRRGFAELFRAHDLSDTQYNVLRILRGAGPEGLTCSDVSNRLIQHDPDVTRLLDRLEVRGVIDRARDTKDRRVVRTRITAEGLTLLDALDGPVDALHDQQLGHLSDEQLAELAASVGDLRKQLR